MAQKQSLPSIRSSAAEYLTFVAVTGDSQTSVEMRYEDENIWLAQKMMAELYGVTVPVINQHLKRIFDDGELQSDAVVKDDLITSTDGENYKANTTTCAPSLFEKYRVVQDCLYESGFDRMLKQLGPDSGSESNE